MNFQDFHFIILLMSVGRIFTPSLYTFKNYYFTMNNAMKLNITKFLHASHAQRIKRKSNFKILRR